MPVASNTDNSRAVIDSINDTIGRQYELPNIAIRKFSNNPARTRKCGEGLCFLDQRISQFSGSLGTIRADVEHDISKIGYRPRGDNYFVVHEAIIFSTSARGTPSPRSS